jgi:hypothetical protein
MKIYILWYSCDPEAGNKPLGVPPLECAYCQGEEDHYIDVFATKEAAMNHIPEAMKANDGAFDKLDNFFVTEPELRLI